VRDYFFHGVGKNIRIIISRVRFERPRGLHHHLCVVKIRAPGLLYQVRKDGAGLGAFTVHPSNILWRIPRSNISQNFKPQGLSCGAALLNFRAVSGSFLEANRPNLSLKPEISYLHSHPLRLWANKALCEAPFFQRLHMLGSHPFKLWASWTFLKHDKSWGYSIEVSYLSITGLTRYWI